MQREDALIGPRAAWESENNVCVDLSLKCLFSSERVTSGVMGLRIHVELGDVAG